MKYVIFFVVWCLVFCLTPAVIHAQPDTLKRMPTVVTLMATDVTDSNAKIGCFINANGFTDLTQWFTWGKGYEYERNTRSVKVEKEFQHFNETIRAQDDTFYSFRCVAEHPALGLMYGHRAHFTTKQEGPNIIHIGTLDATDITAYEATLNAKLPEDAQSSMKVKFQWGEYPGFMYNITEEENFRIREGTVYSKRIVGLKQNTTYQFRATTESRTGTTYGIIQLFTTLKDEALTASPTALLSVFTRTLRIGSTGDDVRTLQQILAIDETLYPEKIVSGYYGSLTREAVRRFQARYDIVSVGDENTTGYGLFGPKTREKFSSVFKDVSVGTNQGAGNIFAFLSGTSLEFSRILKLGDEGEDVKRLQVILNADAETKIVDEGPQSPGQEDEYFSNDVRQALIKFQKKYTLSAKNYGVLDPDTQAKIKAVYKDGVSTLHIEVIKPSEQQTMSTLQGQIDEVLKQVEQLQGQLNNTSQ